jgi:hypothetical protein
MLATRRGFIQASMAVTAMSGTAPAAGAPGARSERAGVEA